MTGRRSWLRRTAGTHLSSPLPRVAAGGDWRALAVNVVVLLLSSTLCAAVVHVAAYHLPWERASGYLLAHCPLRPFLLLVLAGSAVGALYINLVVRVLGREHYALRSRLRRRRVCTPTVGTPRPLSRLILLMAGLFVTCSLWTVVLQHVLPMQVLMAMPGSRVAMDMMLAPAFPLPLGQLVCAALLALLLWRCERRLGILRIAITLLRRLLAATTEERAARISDPARRTPRDRHGLSILSRPPPGASFV